MPTLVVLEGDQTGQELLLEAMRVLDSATIGFALEFERYDLSLANRRATANRVVLDAADAMRRHRVGLKAATITPESRDDVGSPNRILREGIGASVIVRTGRKLPRVLPVGGIHAPISVVRMSFGEG
jgi:isocitrate dehydrogenase (NAD+)